MASLSRVLLLFLALRIASVFIVRTFFVADEYWQSLEVGHRLAFGYGHLTWEWTKGVRSYFLPALIAAVYKALAFLSLDQPELLVYVPRVLQALLSGYADWRFYVWTNKSKWSVFMISIAWFWFYTASRTLGNTWEAALTTIALSYFPWSYGDERTTFLWPVSIAFFLRPTAAIPWIPLCLHHIKKSKFSPTELILKRYLVIGAFVAAAFTALDSFFYGRLIFTPYEFFKVNVVDEIGSFYGKHPWYWYITVGLPTVLGISTIPFLLSTAETLRHYKSFERRLVLLTSVAITLVVYTVLPHKEFRFLLPILPICVYIANDYLSRWSRKASTLLIWIVALTLFIGNLVPAGYLSLVHQRGTIDVTSRLSEVVRGYKDESGQPAKVFFLMPCHSTPYYSHIHANVTLRFLTCEPNFAKQPNYVDEADQFYKEPMRWIRSHLPVHPRSALPTHVVLYDILAPKINDFLTIYRPLESFFHSDYVSDRVGKNVILYERVDVTAKKKEEPVASPAEDQVQN